MPVFEYQCDSCGKKYDVLHKGKEVLDDVVCPHCQSAEHKKLVSIPSRSTESGKAGSMDFSQAPQGDACSSCSSNGYCGMN